MILFDQKAPPESLNMGVLWAEAQGGVIGNNNALAWHVPEDLALFRAVTWGSNVVMGRRTFDSIARPLAGRHSIILSRNIPTTNNPTKDSDGGTVSWVSSWDGVIDAVDRTLIPNPAPIRSGRWFAYDTWAKDFLRQHPMLFDTRHLVHVWLLGGANIFQAALGDAPKGFAWSWYVRTFLDTQIEGDCHMPWQAQDHLSLISRTPMVLGRGGSNDGRNLVCDASWQVWLSHGSRLKTSHDLSLNIWPPHEDCRAHAMDCAPTDILKEP